MGWREEVRVIFNRDKVLFLCNKLSEALGRELWLRLSLYGVSSLGWIDLPSLLLWKLLNSKLRLCLSHWRVCGRIDCTLGVLWSHGIGSVD